DIEAITELVRSGGLPGLGAACYVDLMGEDGELRPAVVVRYDPRLRGPVVAVAEGAPGPLRQDWLRRIAITLRDMKEASPFRARAISPGRILARPEERR